MSNLSIIYNLMSITKISKTEMSKIHTHNDEFVKVKILWNKKNAKFPSASFDRWSSLMISYFSYSCLLFEFCQMVRVERSRRTLFVPRILLSVRLNSKDGRTKLSSSIAILGN